VVAIALISLLLGLTEMKIYHLVAASSVLSLVSLFVPLTAGLFWKKANAIGAMTSMLLGVIGWLIGMYWETVFPDILLGLLAAVVGMLLGSWWGNSKKI
jgi:Na+/proline symporter